MPKRIILIPGRSLLSFVDRYQQLVTAVLLFALLVALGFAVAGWTAARNAEQRVNSAEERVNKLEVERAAERAANEQSKKIAQVATCFAAAKSRPLLTTILRALASGEHDPTVRAAYNALISNFENASTPGIKGSPTASKCTDLAESFDIDPKPYADSR